MSEKEEGAGSPQCVVTMDAERSRGVFRPLREVGPHTEVPSHAKQGMTGLDAEVAGGVRVGFWTSGWAMSRRAKHGRERLAMPADAESKVANRGCI